MYISSNKLRIFFLSKKKFDLTISILLQLLNVAQPKTVTVTEFKCKIFSLLLYRWPVYRNVK